MHTFSYELYNVRVKLGLPPNAQTSIICNWKSILDLPLTHQPLFKI